MAHAVQLVTLEQVEDRLSPHVVRQIYDDANDGAVSKTAIARLIDDATAWVLSWVTPTYTTSITDTPYAAELVRLTLDAVEWMAAKRHHEYVRYDWEKLKADNRQDLIDLRSQMRTIAEAPPDPSATVGGLTIALDPVLFAGGGDI